MESDITVAFRKRDKNGGQPFDRPPTEIYLCSLLLRELINLGSDFAACFCRVKDELAMFIDAVWVVAVHVFSFYLSVMLILGLNADVVGFLDIEKHPKFCHL